MWHSIKEEDVLKQVKSNELGLSTLEVNKRLEENGYNELPQAKKDSIFKMFFREIIDPIILLLLVAVVFSFVVNEYIDAIAIIFIIIIDLSMATFQEWKAGKNAESLSNLIRVKTNVLRDNKEVEVDAKDMVIGDIILLTSGDKISVDARILDCNNLTVNESSLTGESLNVSKEVKLIEENSPLGSRYNMVYAGTTVITGRAKCVVVATAIKTEIGKIAFKVIETKETKSPLTIRMEKFSKQIAILVIIIAIIIAALLFIKGEPGNVIFLSVVALSVSAMPEGLPLAFTMALAISSNRMAKHNVVVKHLNAVESLGSCTVIASDKTGTLTVNEQTAKKIVLPNGEIVDIEGTGYNNIGKVIGNKEAIKKAKQIALMGYINNEASLEYNNENWVSMGDSIDIAFLALASKLEIDDKLVIIDQIPYESENKYSAVFYEENNSSFCTVKGSIEKILSFCSFKDTNITNEEILKQQEKLAKQGYRVIALANGQCNKKDTNNLEANINNLTFLGMVAFIDPLRLESKQAICDCKKAGIKVVMITGDHPLTAYTIAKELDMIDNEEEVADGQEVSYALKQGEEYFDKFIVDKKVFAQVTPLDKLEIVKSYQRQGEFIAVTGDGVNDAPAIKSANIGIAMGSGTDVAKETSDMIVIDDNFKSIVEGIKEGRTAYSNIRKVSYLLLSCGVSEVLFFILSIIFNFPMPLVSIQLLWLNIITNGLQDVALSFEKSESYIMSEKPRDTKDTIFNKDLLLEVMISGLTIGLIVFFVWMSLMNSGTDVALARGYIMVLMVFIQNIHVFNCRSEKLSAFKVSIMKNPFIIVSVVAAIILQVIVMEVPVLSKFLQSASLPFMDIIKMFLFSIIILVIMEIYKLIRYGRKSRCKTIG